MHLSIRLFCLILLLCTLLQDTTAYGWISQAVTPQQQLTHIFFLDDQLFYISKTGKQFGFAMRKTGQVTTPHQLGQNEATIKINRKEKNIVMRKNRNQVFLLNLTTHLIDQLRIQLPFRHQFISDAVFRQQDTILMTRQDIRVYPKGLSTADKPERVFVSGRKGEVFRKIFIEEGQPIEYILLVLVVEDRLCVRNFRFSRKGTDQCLCDSKEEIKVIHKTDDYLLIETKSETFVLALTLDTIFKYSGASLQVHHNLVVLEGFQTFALEKQLLLEGIAVSSSSDRQLWLKKKGGTNFQVQQNGLVIGEFSSKEDPVRSWMEPCQKLCDFQLLLQYPDNFLVMYGQDLTQQPSLYRLWPPAAHYEAYFTNRVKKQENINSDQL